MTTGINTSPFGIYSPWGEFGLDRGTFASQDDITGHLRDIGVKWVQELPSFLALDIVPEDINLYSRIGREAGMVPALIRDSDTVKRFKDELEQTITNGLNRFKYLEVDTEPDGLGGWQNDPEGYVQLLKLCYESVKKISPNCQIMFGGLSGGDALLDNQGTTFLEKVLAAGGAAYFDGLAFKRHHLGVLDYAQIKTHFESIAGILANYGLDIHQMPVFVEAAMYDGDPNDPVPHPFSPNLPVQTETDQASGLVKSYIYAIALGVDKIFWNLVYERSDFEPGHAIPFPQNPFNHYGLIHNPTNSDGFSHRKLAYYSYKKMVAVLDGSDWATVESVQASENIFIFKFIKNGKPLYAAWWDYFQDSAYHPGDTKEIILSNLEAPSARIINAVPNVASGDLVSDYSAAFNEKVMPIKDGALTLSLGEIPVFIEA
ncbi:MAG: hypothetical protein H0S82_00570 [Anaerolineaceae bacterium]|nr:hypothetical protein [Anaerolineaceae bacterium]